MKRILRDERSGSCRLGDHLRDDDKGQIPLERIQKLSVHFPPEHRLQVGIPAFTCAS